MSDVNTVVHEYTVKQDAWPTPQGYYGFPNSICTSLNEVVVHGTPSDRKFKKEDFINLDMTV